MSQDQTHHRLYGFYIFADVCNFSVPVLLPPIYSARILGIQPIHFILSPTYNVIYMYRDSIHI
nr:MAG TPA: hypothetical protein [Caudoviricetes sp.]